MIYLSEVTLRYLVETQNLLVRACSHRLVSTRCWPVKPKSSLRGFFISDRTPHDSKHLNRWRGRKDTYLMHPSLGSSLLARDWSSSRGNGETNSRMNESLPSGHLGIPLLGILGRAYHPWGSIV